MDGNGRWALARGLPRIAGHRAGTENLRRVIRASVEFGIKYLTIYAFSTENWGRPPEEVQRPAAHPGGCDRPRAGRAGPGRGAAATHRTPGTPLAHAPEKVLQAIERTKNNDRLILNVAFNYGGRDEIVQAIQHMMKDGIPPEKVTDELVSQYLYTAGVPDPDLIIRTSGELRVSNFLIWQAAYAELYSTPTYWPDFDKEEYRRALETFGQRDRRFGGVSEVVANKSHG